MELSVGLLNEALVSPQVAQAHYESPEQHHPT